MSEEKSSAAKKQLDLTEDEIQEFREVFDLMDRDKGGTLSTDEVKQLMDLLGMKVRQEELEQLISEIDVDGSGEVDFDEFLQVMARPQELPYTREDVTRAFRMFADPKDPNGMITPEVLEKALIKFGGNKLPESEIIRLMHNLSFTDDGYIDYKSKVDLYLSK
eukprot:gene15905-22038_t